MTVKNWSIIICLLLAGIFQSHPITGLIYMPYSNASAAQSEPVLQPVYATLLGGASEDRAHGLAVDNQSNVYVTAPAGSTDFPVTAGALSTEFTGIYAAKLNPAGDSLLFSTFLGTSGGANYAHGIAVDAAGYVYVTGNTTNPDFPTTPGAFDETFNGPQNASHGDAFVMKLSPDGSEIVYSTFIGGTGMDLSGKIAVDAEGNAYVVGTTSSPDFPVTPDAYDTTFNGGEGDGRDDIFVFKLDPSGSKLIYSTYLGGSSTELHGANILIDPAGSVYVTGTTASSDFPTTDGAYDTSYNGGSGDFGVGDIHLVKLNPAGTDLEYATLIGGSGDDSATNVALDTEGNIYLAGQTNSPDFPTTSGAYNDTIQGGTDGFFLKLDPSGDQIMMASLLGGSQNEDAQIMIDPSGMIVLSGSTESDDFPITADGYKTTFSGGTEIFITLIDPITQSMTYSTYWGGKSNDNVVAVFLTGHDLYLVGNTNSSDFPGTDGAYDQSYNGGTSPWGGDAFIVKFLITP